MRKKSIKRLPQLEEEGSEEKSVDHNDVLYYPQNIMNEKLEPIFDKAGNKKMFFPFREMRSDEAYLKITERLKADKKVKPTEALITKLNWNSKVHNKQTKVIKEMSTRTFSNLVTTARQWKVKTSKIPIIIRRYTSSNIQETPG